MKLTLRQRAQATQVVIDAWNHHFFMPRHLYFRLSKVGRFPRSDGSYRYDSGNEDDTDSWQDRDSDDGDNASGYATSSNVRRVSMRRKPDVTYRLSCISLASRNPLSRLVPGVLTDQRGPYPDRPPGAGTPRRSPPPVIVSAPTIY